MTAGGGPRDQMSVWRLGATHGLDVVSRKFAVRVALATLGRPLRAQCGFVNFQTKCHFPKISEDSMSPLRQHRGTPQTE